MILINFGGSFAFVTYLYLFAFELTGLLFISQGQEFGCLPSSVVLNCTGMLGFVLALPF